MLSAFYLLEAISSVAAVLSAVLAVVRFAVVLGVELVPGLVSSDAAQ